MAKQDGKKTQQKADRGIAQREDAIRSFDKAMETQAKLRTTPHPKEKLASMKRDHSKPKYREP